MQSSPLGKLLLTWALITLVLVGFRDVLTERVWHWFPIENPEWYLYADDTFGGASYVERASAEGINIRCNLREPPIDLEPFCGLHVYLDGTVHPPAVDLSNFETMQVDVDYRGGNEKLRFYIREYFEGYSDPENPVDTAKYMSLYVRASETEHPITIDMQEFTVADWWVNNNNVPRQYAMGSLNNVVAFGIDIAYPAALGKHSLTLNKVTFTGHWVSAEKWYLGILMSWVGVIVIGGLLRLAQFRRLAMTLRRQKERYRELSQVDPLTGLKNRQGLKTFINRELVDDAQAPWPASFLFIDVDHFKPINDHHGHAAGDKVLQRVAECMRDCCRDSDQVARWGGEEFLMVMPATSMAAASRVAERLRQAIAQIHHPAIGGQAVTVSVGVSTARQASDIEAVIESADMALYEAKRAGRNQVQHRAANLPAQ